MYTYKRNYFFLYKQGVLVKVKYRVKNPYNYYNYKYQNIEVINQIYLIM